MENQTKEKTFLKVPSPVTPLVVFTTVSIGFH